MSKGTLVIDRLCGPLGRLRIASGTHNKEEFRQLNGMVGQLMHDHEWGLLDLLKNRAVTPRKLYLARWRGEKLHATDLRPLKDALDAWLVTYEGAESTKETYRGIIDRFTARHPGAPLGTVAELLLSEKAGDKKATWNLLRSLLLSFLGDTVKKRHELYMAVQDVPPLKVAHRPGNPQTVEQVRALVQAMPKDAATIWALCLTGMRKGEYWGAWELLPDRIIVHGTKTKAALRTIPNVFPIALPRSDYWRFVERLRDVTGGTVRPHDFRKTYAGWLEDAGVARTRRKMYLGHAVGDVTELYERRELSQYLVDDAERVRTWLGEPPSHQLQVVAG